MPTTSRSSEPPRRLLLAVPSFFLQGLRGFCPADEVDPATILQHATLLDKGLAEQDPTYRQVCTYCLVRSPVGGNVLTYTRPAGQGDRRLRLFRSLGVGGHVERKDLHDGLMLDLDPDAPGAAMKAVENAVYRELAEELGEPQVASIGYRGLISLDWDAVSRCHLGMVYEVKLATVAGLAFSDEIAEPAFLGRRHVDRTALESWSQVLYDEWEDGTLFAGQRRKPDPDAAPATESKAASA